MSDPFRHRSVLMSVDLDMSTAIATSPTFGRPGGFPDGALFGQDISVSSGLVADEPLDLVPSFYNYALKAFLLPIRKVQHELVILYFQYIHPLFPVVDESYFTELHRNYRAQEHLMAPADFVLYQAIIAAGFGVSELSCMQSSPAKTNSSI